jgi:hypothetical protein
LAPSTTSNNANNHAESRRLKFLDCTRLWYSSTIRKSRMSALGQVTELFNAQVDAPEKPIAPNTIFFVSFGTIRG